MFGLTKNSSQNQSAAFNLDEAPIHTMQDDLKNIKNIDTQHDPITSAAEEKKTLASEPATSLRQSNSPFLNLADRNPLGGIIASNEKDRPANSMTNIPNNSELIEKNSSMSIAQTQKSFYTNSPADTSGFKATPSTTKDSIAPHGNWKTFFFAAFSFVFIATLGWIGYTYYHNRNLNSINKTAATPTPTVTEPDQTTPVEQPVVKPILTYSQTNPNYLRLDDPNLDATKIEPILKQYVDTISKEDYTMPVEFVVTDYQNKAMSFKSFANLLGLKFSPALLALLGDNFNLYIYKDITASKIGISIESRDDINLTKVLLSEEKNLANELSPLFFTSEYRTEKTFADSTYGAARVRFQNIISPDMLSVDYTIYQNKLLIGTTKLTLRSMIDKINSIPGTNMPDQAGNVSPSTGNTTVNPSN